MMDNDNNRLIRDELKEVRKELTKSRIEALKAYVMVDELMDTLKEFKKDLLEMRKASNRGKND